MPELYLIGALLSGVACVFAAWKTSRQIAYPLMGLSHKLMPTSLYIVVVLSIYGFAFLTAFLIAFYVIAT